jgi:hypothetical protein
VEPALCANLRAALRLFAARERVECRLPHQLRQRHKHVTFDVQRFSESIGGRAYVIEASLVSKDRWRAYIVRVPGMPTALMPFYGRTPTEAAQHLCAWLSRAHERAAGPAL